MRVKDLIQNELFGWKDWEVGWLITACLEIMVLSIYWLDIAIGIMSASTGVACVVYTANNKLQDGFGHHRPII